MRHEMTPQQIYKNPKTRQLLMNMCDATNGKKRKTAKFGARVGAATELDFAAECMFRGATVSRPLNPDSKYDLIVDSGTNMCRVQVKTGTESQFDASYSVNTTASMGKPYTAEDCDYIVGSVGRDWLFFDVLDYHQSTTCKVTPDYHAIGHNETKNRWDLLGLPAKRLNDYS